MGNQIIQDYYVVFDATPADEHNKHFIQVGIAKKNAAHIYQLEKGSEYNIKYDESGKEIDVVKNSDSDISTKPTRATDKLPSQRKELEGSSFFGVVLLLTILIGGFTYFICKTFKKKKLNDAKNDMDHQIRRESLKVKRESIKRRQSLVKQE